MLPTAKQFEMASKALHLARDCAVAIVMIDACDVNDDEIKTRSIEALKDAATALGFELVQRVTPAARDGGRMDIPEVAGVGVVADA